MPKPNCSEISRVLTEIALNLGSREGVNTIDDVVKLMQKDMPQIDRAQLVNAINEATSGHAQAVDELTQKLNQIKREARGDVNIRKRINSIQQQLRDGTLPPKTAKKSQPPSDVIAELRSIAKDLETQMRWSEPAVRQRLSESISKLTDRLESNNVTPPIKRNVFPQTREIERLMYQRDRLRSRVRQRIRDLKPKTGFERIAEPLNLFRSMMTSMDFSAVLRQGGFIVMGNPVRGLRAMGPMLRSFASDEAAHKAAQELENRPNAPLYARAKLYLAPSDSDASLSKQEEAFMSRLAEKIPGVKQSARAYSTFLNKLRADSFDAMAGSLAPNGEPTLEEAKAIANFVNVATGRGSLWKAENNAELLNTLFFSPRFVASRFQLIAGQPLMGGTANTRKLIAKEYAKTLMGLGVVYALGIWAGGEIEKDPRSSDFGKIRFGDTRLDPLMGIAQAGTLIGRLGFGETKKLSGENSPLRGEDVPYGGTTVPSVLGSFVRSKLAPIPGAALDILAGEDMARHPVTFGSKAADLLMPMSFGEIYKALKDQGASRGAALSLLSIFGMGLQVHDESPKDTGRPKPPSPPKPSRVSKPSL